MEIAPELARLMGLVAPGMTGMGSGGIPLPQQPSGQGALDQLAMQTMFVPVLGDLMGLGADAQMYATDPESRTLGNYALTGAGMLPWVPSAAALKTVGGAGLMGIMAGVGAKTADLKALEKAKSLAGSGADKADVLKETGWFQGADGQWRFEIPDNKSSYDPDALAELRDGARAEGRAFSPRNDTSFLGGVLNHPDLFRAYPEIENTRVHFLPPSVLGGAGGAYGGKVDRLSLRDDLSPEQAHSLLLHETQHAIQRREGFEGGGSVREMASKLPDEQAISDAEVLQAFVRRGIAPKDAPSEFLNTVGRDPHPASRSLYMAHSSGELQNMKPLNAYRRLAGETEARNVQTRMGMNAAQLRETPPWATQDIPNEQQIIRRLLGVPE